MTGDWKHRDQARSGTARVDDPRRRGGPREDTDQATERRGSTEFYGAERRSSRREWDPGNYGGLDHERGPGRSGLNQDRGYGPASDHREGFSSGSRFHAAQDRRGRENADLPPGTAGGFTGLGPKGYSRSETRVLEDVCEGLTEDDGLDASGISVTVSQGEVTLAGTIPSRQARRLAEDIAERCRGVNYVQNNLRVQAGAGSSGK